MAILKADQIGYRIIIAAMMRINPADLSPAEQEHVTPFFYRNADQFCIVSLASGEPERAKLRLVIDEIDDLRSLEQLMESGHALPEYKWLSSKILGVGEAAAGNISGPKAHEI